MIWVTVRATFLIIAAPAVADDDVILREGDRIERATPTLWRIIDDHGRVRGYIRTDPAYPGRARITDRSGNTTSEDCGDSAPK